MSTNPKANEWKPLVDRLISADGTPPFTDDDGRLYMYSSSSNRYPIYGVELNRKTLQPKGAEKKCISWNRTGRTDGNDLANIPTTLSSTRSLKGPGCRSITVNIACSMARLAPEFSGYADGVLVETPGSPLPLNPTHSVSSRADFPGRRPRPLPFQDNKGKWWHVSTSIVCVKNTFERRIGIWPRIRQG